MTDFENINEDARKKWEHRMEQHSRSGRVWTGIFIVIIGVVALLKSFAVPLPDWFFSWQVLLIGIGLFVGLRHGFRKGGWFIPIIIGGVFLANDYFLDVNIRPHLWPIVLIVLGIIFILRPRKHNNCHRHRRWQRRWEEKKNNPWHAPYNEPVEESHNEDDLIDVTSIFGRSKKNILSKNFKGGDIVNIFGGNEINFSQADIQGKATLEITAIFGGAVLIVPSNWMIKSEAVTIFGGIEDKRSLPATGEHAGRTLILKGTVLFGGIEIKSY